ncbi:MAG: alpha/beta hydrolase family protein [Anaerolineales bacterium]
MARRFFFLFIALGVTWLPGCQAPAQPAATTAPPFVAITEGPTVGALSSASPSSPTQIATPAGSPLAISAMRLKAYPGSDLVFEGTLSPGSNYSRHVVSYQSDGLTLFGLLTIPAGNKPSGGWPVILLNHGYIPPAEYSTDLSYERIVDPLASAGYIVFKPDYRGHDRSPGTPYQPYVDPGYVTDSMNALASIRMYRDANPDEIGVWGHSMGGNVTLHELVLTHTFKGAVLMSGVVGSYSGLIDWWAQRVATGVLTTQNDLQADQMLLEMIDLHGTPQTDPGFWNAIDPTRFLSDVTAPVLIQVGTADTVVPQSFSEDLAAALRANGKTVTFNIFPGADHNLAPDTPSAMAQAVAFFNQYLK